MKMKYQLRIDFNITAFDDPDARSKAISLLKELGVRNDELKNVKLQKIVEGKAPTGLSIGDVDLESK